MQIEPARYVPARAFGCATLSGVIACDFPIRQVLSLQLCPSRYVFGDEACVC